MPSSSYNENPVAGRYAFIDLGSGKGGSIDHCVRRFGRSPGRGFELDPSEVAEARRAGFDVVEADVRLVTVPDRSVEYIAAMDFLEHLPDVATAASVLEKFGRAARSFIFIRHPSFEETEYLESIGLKLCWSDWEDHPNMMRIEDLEKLFARLGWKEWAIIPRKLIVDSMDDQVVPLSAPPNTFVYDPALLAPKPQVRFDRPVFGQYDIFVRLDKGLNDVDWANFLSTEFASAEAAWSAKIISERPVTSKPVRGEFGFYDSKTSLWTLRSMAGSERSLIYGVPGQDFLPLIGNFSGCGSGLGIYDAATGYFSLRHSIDEGVADVIVNFGAEGSMPVAGDWTGSGSDKIGIYVPATGQWFLSYSNTAGQADETFSFDTPNVGWLPVVGDWDGDGRDSVGLYDPDTGAWHLRGGSPDGRSDISFSFSPAGGLPVAGDWDGDGRDSVGVYMPDWGMWILRNENTNGPADATFVYRGDGAPVALSF